MSISAAEASIINTLVTLPGTTNWTNGSCQRVARIILADLIANGAVISFPINRPPITVLSESDMRMRRLVEMDRRDR